IGRVRRAVQLELPMPAEEVPQPTATAVAILPLARLREALVVVGVLDEGPDFLGALFLGHRRNRDKDQQRSQQHVLAHTFAPYDTLTIRPQRVRWAYPMRFVKRA